MCLLLTLYLLRQLFRGAANSIIILLPFYLILGCFDLGFVLSLIDFQIYPMFVSGLSR
jgi:hypothetical protein